MTDVADEGGIRIDGVTIKKKKKNKKKKTLISINNQFIYLFYL
jgi:hypothetical protein